MGAVRTLFSEDEIAARVASLARQIADALPEDFVVVGVLKGSFIFVADLVRALSRLGRRPGIEFIRLASYGSGRTSGGTVTLVGDVPAAIRGRPVLLVDDIADTGHTLQAAVPLLREHGATRVWSCVLIDKPTRREVPIAADFKGFDVPDIFIVGYGIDYADQHRERPDIGTID